MGVGNGELGNRKLKPKPGPPQLLGFCFCFFVGGILWREQAAQGLFAAATQTLYAPHPRP